MPGVPSKSHDLADENNKILTEWKWFQTTVFHQYQQPPLILTHWTQIRQQDMTLEIQVLACDLWLAQKLYLETLTIESEKLARTHVSDVKLQVRGQWPQPFCHTDNPHAMGQNKVKG